MHKPAAPSVGAVAPGVVEVEDVQGGRRRVSLLALDGPYPCVGSGW